MKKYSVTIKTVLNAINEVLIYSIIALLFIIFLFYYFGSDDLNLALVLAFLVLAVHILVFVLPVLILYINYIEYDRNTELILEKDKLIYNKENIYLKDIEKFKIFATYQHFSGINGSTSLPYNDYFYYIELIKKNGDKKILTSLLGYDLDKDLQKKYPNIVYENIIKGFPKI